MRPSARQRGYTTQWDKARLAWLDEHPLCVHCLADEIVTPATDVDHVIPHRGDDRLFWDRSNWQSLCHSHHSKKTNAEDGGFGRLAATDRG